MDKNVSVKDYIYSKTELEYMPFMVVYTTIMTLAKDGLLSLEDFKNVEHIQFESQR